MLADPYVSYPALFGTDLIFGGKDGVLWMKQYPYALPNLTSAVFLCLSSLAVLFFLEETSELCRHKPDAGLRISRWIRRAIFSQRVASGAGYSAVPEDDFELQPTPTSTHAESFNNPDKSSNVFRKQLPFRRLWTRNLITTLFAHGVLTMHVGTFGGL